MTEFDVASFRRAVDGKPPEIQKAIITGISLGGNKDLLQHALMQHMGQTLDAVGTTEYFRKKSGEQTSSEQVEVRASTETITVDREILLWAEDIRDQFISLPDKQPKIGKNAEKRDRQFLIDTLSSVSINKGEPQHVLYQPAIIARMFESWLAKVDDDETGRTEKLLSTAANYLEQKISKDWHKVPKIALAGYARELAHGSLAEKYLEDLLNSYFEGPNNAIDRLTSHINFTLSAKFALEDQPTIDKLAEIAGFRTSVLTPDHELLKALQAYGSLVVPEHAIKRANANEIFIALSMMSSLRDSPVSYPIEFSAEELGDYQDAETASDIKQLMRDGLTRSSAIKVIKSRNKLMTRIENREFNNQLVAIAVNKVLQEYGEETARWFHSTRGLHSEEEKEYLRAFGFRIRAISRAKKLAEDEGAGYQMQDILSAPYGQYVIDVYVPTGIELIKNGYQEIIEKALEALNREDERFELELNELGLSDDRISTDSEMTVKIQFRGQPVFVGFRPSCQLDKLHDHQLNRLLWENVPDIEGEEFVSAQEIAQRIKENQRWYIGPRTFEVEFKSAEMREAGFEKIAFRRPEGDKNIYVTLTHQGRAIEYRINSNWQLDLEGKGIHSSKLKGIIERRTLAILEAYSTPELIETSKGTISEKGSSPGIGFVPAKVVWVGGFKGDGSPKSFTDDQWLEYLEQEGKDLAVVSAQRQEREDSQGRHSTYRKWYGLPDGPPIELYIEDERII